MGGNSLLNILIQTVKSKMTGFVTKFRMYTSWSFIKTRVVVKIREFFSNLLGFKPRDNEDYYSIGRWMISKRLVYAAVLIVGVVSIWYISTETSLFKHFDEDGIKTYDYNSLRLRVAKGRVRIKGKSGYKAYEGDVEDGYATGEGTLYNPAGNVVYTGNFLQNKYEGEGTLNFSDGSLKYRGGFHDNKFDGSGVLYRENGTKEYEGAFSRGMKNGPGILYDAGENELYAGSFASDNIVYSEMLGKSAEEVAGCYKGDRDLYMTDEESVVYMSGIGAIYHGVRNIESLDDEEKVSEVYVLSDHFDFSDEASKSISDIKDILGNPIYEGYSKIILPEAIAIDILNSRSEAFKGVQNLDTTEVFSDVSNVESYDSDYEVYIYTFQRGDVFYSFVCPDQTGDFKFYYISQENESAA